MNFLLLQLLVARGTFAIHIDASTHLLIINFLLLTSKLVFNQYQTCNALTANYK